MADPLSIAASVGGLVALTLQIIQINKSYIDSVKTAPRILNAYQRELVMLQSSLNLLQERLSNPNIKTYLRARQQQSASTLQLAKDSIASCSADMRKTLLGIEKRKNSSMVVQRMTWYFSEGEVEQELQRLQRYRSMIMDDFNSALSVGHSNKLGDLLVTTAEVERLSKTMARDIHLLDENISTIQATGDRVRSVVELTQKDMARLTDFEDATYEASVLNWVTTTDTSPNHNSARKLHEGDTGRWLIDLPAYSEWYQNAGKILWLQGIAGSGKTVLCSTVIEDVRRSIQVDEISDVACGYFYFDFRDMQKQSINTLMRSLVRQLSSSKSPVWPKLASLHDQHVRSGQVLGDTVLLDLLVEVVEGRKRTLIMIDALDECKEKEDAVDTIVEVYNRTADKLSLFITSRPDSYLQDTLLDIDDRQWTKVRARNAAVDRDISDFIRARMENDRKLRRWKGETDYITESLVSQAGGMFRWVACQFDAICKTRSVNELHRILASLPKTLEATYERILAQIEENDQERVRALLLWLAFRDSSHPKFHWYPSFTLPEVAEAAVVNESRTFDPGDRLQEPRELLDIASSLVSEDSALYGDLPSIVLNGTPILQNVEIVRLAHSSVLEYLQSQRLQESALSIFYLAETQAHIVLAKSCLQYLLFFDDPSISLEKEKSWRDAFPLLEYAACSWGFHLQRADLDIEKGAEIYDLAVKVLRKDSHSFTNWWFVLESLSLGLAGPLSYALQNNLSALFKVLVHNGHDPCDEETQSINSEEKVILHTDGAWGLLKPCIENDNVAVLKILLDNKAYLREVGPRLPRYLALAITQQRLEIVAVLKEYGVELEPSSWEDAIKAYRIPDVQNMIRSGIPVNAYIHLDDNPAMSLLGWTVSHNQSDLVTSLLEAGADPFLVVNFDLPDGSKFCGPVLPLSFLLGYKRIFHTLSIHNGGSIDSIFETHQFHRRLFRGTLLLHQALHGSPIKVLILLGKGPNVEVEQDVIGGTMGDQMTGTVLHSAILQGNSQLVKWLLCSGANVGAACHVRYKDVLLTSSRSSRVSRTKHKEEYNIAVTPCGLCAETSSPLIFLRSLLSHGARPNVANNNEDDDEVDDGVNDDDNNDDALVVPPLISHITRVQVECVEILLKHAADIHYNGRYGTPLYHASHLFDKRLEKVLRKAGAQDVSTVSYWAGN